MNFRWGIPAAFAFVFALGNGPAFSQVQFDKAIGKIESAIRGQTGPRQAKPGGAEAQQATEMRDQPKESSASASQSNSSLDRLLGNDADSLQGQAGAGSTKAEFFSSFEKHYFEVASSSGAISDMQRKYMDIGNSLARMLPSEFGISIQCVQQRARDGRISGTSQARSIAAAMYDILDKLAAPERSNALRARFDSLARPGSGCPNDFAGIKQYLDTYTEFAIQLVDRHQKAVAERQSQMREAEREAKLAADRKRSEEDAKNREAQARDEAQKTAMREAQEKRRASLRSGAAKPNSFQDHMLMHDYVWGEQYFSSPLVEPDGKVYLFGTGALDRKDGNDLILKNPDGYVIVRPKRGTPIYGELQVNRLTVVLGRYVANAQYTTVIGAVKTAPVIEAIAISKAPVQF